MPLQTVSLYELKNSPARVMQLLHQHPGKKLLIQTRKGGRKILMRQSFVRGDAEFEVKLSEPGAAVQPDFISSVFHSVAAGDKFRISIPVMPLPGTNGLRKAAVLTPCK